MHEAQDQSTVQLYEVYKTLAGAIEGWASRLGIHTTYSDPVLEEWGSNDWADELRRECDRAMRTAASLLTAHGRFEHADNLKRRMDELFEAADAYEQRLDALEDQCRVHIEGVEARYRQMFGDDDPESHRLWQLSQGRQRIWTLDIEGGGPQTPEQFAEAIDRAWFDEHGAKLKARAGVHRLARELAEHLRLLAQFAADASRKATAVPATEPEKRKRGKRGPARMPLAEAWRYLSIVQEWEDIRERNRKLPLRDRFQKVQMAERHGITVRELNAMLAWYAKHHREERFPADPRTLSRGELEKWFA